jgi:hypothetical protein
MSTITTTDGAEVSDKDFGEVISEISAGSRSKE